MMSRSFLRSIAIALLVLIAEAGADEIIVETLHATIESKEGQRLRVVFASEDRPAISFKPKGGRLGLVSGEPARYPGRKSQRPSADSAIARQ